MTDQAAARSLAQGIKKLTIEIEIPGVPPNWKHFMGSSQQRDRAKRPWVERAALKALEARHLAGWPVPVKTYPPATRYLEIRIYKKRPHYDPDGAVSCLWPYIDGCFSGRRAEFRDGEIVIVSAPPGILAWDDKGEWLAQLTPPSDLQIPVGTIAQERVVFTVHLGDPRRPL